MHRQDLQSFWHLIVEAGRLHLWKQLGATPCPLCHLNLDAQQRDAARRTT